MQMICCYAYFLWTHRDFGYEQHFTDVHKRSVNKLIRRQGFDEARYVHLKHELMRWQRYAKALAKARV